MRTVFCVFLAGVLLSGGHLVRVTAQTPATATQDGEAIYRANCASCHEAGVPRAVDRTTLARMAADNIRFALTQGAMMQQASRLTPADIDNVVRYITAASGAAAATPTVNNRCQPQNPPSTP
jgi:mono/diheme cytochrome c family protein